ncbi:MAG: DUF2590 family protein [Methylococcales bacterium]
MASYVDIYITDNDLTLDSSGEPMLVNDRASIAQDIKHLIRESGLMVTIIGQRSRLIVADAIQRLVLLIEEDERLVPGTIKITEPSFEGYWVQADTELFGPLGFTIGRVTTGLSQSLGDGLMLDQSGNILTDQLGNILQGQL